MTQINLASAARRQPLTFGLYSWCLTQVIAPPRTESFVIGTGMSSQVVWVGDDGVDHVHAIGEGERAMSGVPAVSAQESLEMGDPHGLVDTNSTRIRSDSERWFQSIKSPRKDFQLPVMEDLGVVSQSRPGRRNVPCCSRSSCISTRVPSTPVVGISLHPSISSLISCFQTFSIEFGRLLSIVFA